MRFKWHRFGKALIEVSWLAAAAVIPLFFNISSVQVFEPDKMFVLKFLVAIAGAAWLLTWGWPIQSSGSCLRSFIRIPLIKPILALTAVYLVSSFCSIIPQLSWLGSYRRAQGTVAFLCYLIIFLLLVSELRRADQLKRLQFILILTSIPAASYAILQRFSMDPLPWKGLVGRSSSTMGNPIFLGGYLAMVLPLTLCRMAEGFGRLRQKAARKPGVLLICSCMLALILQAGALIATQSRGPLIGLVVALYLCVFVVLVLHRSPGNRSFVPALAAVGIGMLVPLLALAVVRLGSRLPAMVFFSIFGAFAGLSLFGYYFFYRASWGRSWFWLTWLSQLIPVVLLLVLVSAGFINPLTMPGLGRLAKTSDPVRQGLWITSIRYAQEGAPAVLPDGTRDPRHFLRWAFGYGPECAWVPGNLYAVPALIQLHPEAPMDRMHNEVYDDLITLGHVGVIAYLILIAVAIFLTLRFLGFNCEGRWRALFFLFAGLGGFVGIGVSFWTKAPYMAGIGVLAGLLTGTVVFIGVSGFCAPCVETRFKPGQWLVLGLAGGIIAHIIETGFAMAVAPTRLYFYLFLGILAAVSFRNPAHREEETTSGHDKIGKDRGNPLISYASISGLVLLVPIWFFIFNVTPGLNSLQIFRHSWFSFTTQRLPVPAALAVLLLTVAVNIGLLMSEIPEAGMRKVVVRKTVVLFVASVAALWVVVGWITAAFWTVEDGTFPVLIAQQAEARISLFGICLMLLLGLLTVILSSSNERKLGESVWHKGQWAFGCTVLFCSLAAIWMLSVRPAWADVAARAANAYKSSGNASAAIELYQRASDLGTGESVYRLSLGLAHSSAAYSGVADLSHAGEVLQSALEMNRLDPSTYMTLGAFYEQIAERSTDPAVRKDGLEHAISFFQKQAALAIHFPAAYSRIGRCLFLLGDYSSAEDYLGKALQLAPRYVGTHMVMGEMYYRQNELQKALKSYSTAARLSRGNIEARKNVVALLALLNRRDEAIRITLDTLRDAPRDSYLLKRLATLYFGKGDPDAGAVYAQRAFEATPAGERKTLDQFVNELKAQSY